MVNVYFKNCAVLLKTYLLKLEKTRSKFIKSYKRLQFLILLEKISKLNIIHNEIIADLSDYISNKNVNMASLDPRKHLKKIVKKEITAAYLVEKYRTRVMRAFVLGHASDIAWITEKNEIWNKTCLKKGRGGARYSTNFFLKTEGQLNTTYDKIIYSKAKKLVEVYYMERAEALFTLASDDLFLIFQIQEALELEKPDNADVFLKNVERWKTESLDINISHARKLFGWKSEYLKNSEEIDVIIARIDESFTYDFGVPSDADFNIFFSIIKKELDV